jgi:hypothetical protein
VNPALKAKSVTKTLGFLIELTPANAIALRSPRTDYIKPQITANAASGGKRRRIRQQPGCGVVQQVLLKPGNRLVAHPACLGRDGSNGLDLSR